MTKIIKQVGPFFLGVLTVGLLSCSQDSAFQLALKKTAVACFGANCGGCSRVEGYIGVAMNTQEPENLKKLSNYFSEKGEVNNIVPDTVYGGYIPLWNNLYVGNFTVKASSGNEYPRDGKSVVNYFGIKTITRLVAPKEVEHPLAQFFRSHLEGKDIKLLFLVEGPAEIKTFDVEGKRKRVVKIEEASSDGALQLVCVEQTVRFENGNGINLEIDGAFAKGDVNSPGYITIYPGISEANNPNLESLCGATVYRDDNPDRPTAEGTLLESQIMGKGIFPVPNELFQTAEESRKKFPEMEDCPVDQFQNP